MLRWCIAIVVLVAVAAAGTLYFFRNQRRVAAYVPQSVRTLLPARTDPQQAPTPAAAAPPRSAPPVETAPVEVGRVTEEVEALGTLAANESVVIAPEIAGRVTRLGFKEGENVKEGQVLVALDAAILETEVKQAQANLDLARDTYERARALAQRGTGTQVALEQATAQLAANEASVALAKARLERATIVAPFGGVVGLRSVSVGDFVAVGQNLVTLTDIDPIKVDFRVPEIFLGKVKDGQAIQIRLGAIPDRTFEGRIYAIDPVIDVNGRAIRLRAQIPNPDLTRLKPWEARGRTQQQIVAEINRDLHRSPVSACSQRTRPRSAAAGRAAGRSSSCCARRRTTTGSRPTSMPSSPKRASRPRSQISRATSSSTSRR